MTLDEAIRLEEGFAKQCSDAVEVLEKQHLPNTATKYREEAEEHRQLAEWLKELKEFRGESNE